MTSHDGSRVENYVPKLFTRLGAGSNLRERKSFFLQKMSKKADVVSEKITRTKLTAFRLLTVMPSKEACLCVYKLLAKSPNKGRTDLM